MLDSAIEGAPSLSGMDAATSFSVLADFLTQEQLAAELGISVRTLRRLHARGEAPPCSRIGRLILYPIAAFRQWLLDKAKASDLEPLRKRKAGRLYRGR
jgi:hypothetical protein